MTGFYFLFPARYLCFQVSGQKDAGEGVQPAPAIANLPPPPNLLAARVAIGSTPAMPPSLFTAPHTSATHEGSRIAVPPQQFHANLSFPQAHSGAARFSHLHTHNSQQAGLAMQGTNCNPGILPGSRVTSIYDTFDHMSLPGQQTLRPPGQGASQEEQMEFIQKQLQSLEGKAVLNVFVVKEGGGNRLQGGTALEPPSTPPPRLLHTAVFLPLKKFEDCDSSSQVVYRQKRAVGCKCTTFSPPNAMFSVTFHTCRYCLPACTSRMHIAQDHNIQVLMWPDMNHITLLQVKGWFSLPCTRTTN